MKPADTDHLNAFLKDPADTSTPDRAELDRLLKTYPWFNTARVLRERKHPSGDPLRGLAMLTRPMPGYQLEHPSTADFEQRSEDQIIDNFLLRGEYKIVPQDDTPEVELSAGQEDDDEITASEELAEIYLAQGLHAQAKSIYSKLSLLYPEKSVYFAEIIAKITAQNE